MKPIMRSIFFFLLVMVFIFSVTGQNSDLLDIDNIKTFYKICLSYGDYIYWKSLSYSDTAGIFQSLDLDVKYMLYAVCRDEGKAFLSLYENTNSGPFHEACEKNINVLIDLPNISISYIEQSALMSIRGALFIEVAQEILKSNIRFHPDQNIRKIYENNLEKLNKIASKSWSKEIVDRGEEYTVLDILKSIK